MLRLRAQKPVSSGVHATSSGLAVELLKADILVGKFKPASKLRVQELHRIYGVGLTPIREALTRLAAIGLIDQHGQRGFTVPSANQQAVLDLMQARRLIEREALRLSIVNGHAAWEDGIVTAYHLFIREAERFHTDQQSVQAYWQRHCEFHFALVGACPNQVIKDFVGNIYVRLSRFKPLTHSQGIALPIGSKTR